MKSKKRAVLGVLLSTGLYLLDNLRERGPDNMDDIKGRAREKSRPNVWDGGSIHWPTLELKQLLFPTEN